MDLPLYYHFFFFFFNDTATTEIYTLSLHDALPILPATPDGYLAGLLHPVPFPVRSEEHTSELQSRSDLVCRLLLEKKKTVDNLYSFNRTRKQYSISSERLTRS